MSEAFGSKCEVISECSDSSSASAEDSNIIGTRYWAGITTTLRTYAWRDYEFNDSTLYIKVYVDAASADIGTNATIFKSISATFGRSVYLYKPDGTYGSAKNQNGSYKTFGSQTNIPLSLYGFPTFELGTITVTNYDKYDGTTGNENEILTSGYIKMWHLAKIDGLGSPATKDYKRYYTIPPYKEIVPTTFPSGPNNGGGNGGIDVSDSKTQLKLNKKYSITRAGDTTQNISWSPSISMGPYNQTIETRVTVNGSTYNKNGESTYSFTTPNIIGSSYTAVVKRYYTACTSIMTTSNTLTLYTYQKPTLNSISLNKYNISARNGESLTLSLDCNNRRWTIENNFRTGIWSNYKAKYYIDYETTDKSRVLSVAEIKTLAPDTKASNGVTTATISVNRRNLGVSGGNPSSGNLVYETAEKTATLKVYYKPQVQLNPNDGSISYFKVENNTRGASIQPKTTWVLPNTYNISNMTGIDVRLQYPKTDTSGVISGYKIELLLPNDGTHGTDYVWKTLYYYTEEYDYYARISYDDLKRGISGNRIRITPFYIPSNVNQGNTGSYWYGPSTTKDFVDISWMLNDPIIDCPLNGTTWHNHQYRILFKLPVDNDTNYKGTNDIEVHYGSGKYRYQEIEISINGRKTLLGNNAYMNAQNNWVSVTNVNNAKLTYLREIIINPTLIPSYSNESSYRILIRVRKAYGQNTNFDGWSNWSSVVVVNKKTVSNTNVQRHEYIMASHYMNVQNAFNNSLSCYAKKASDNSNFVAQESFDRSRGHNINGPHLSPPENTPLQTVKEYVSEFNDLHQLKTKINSYAKFDTDKNRNSVKLDYQNKLLASFIPLQEFITAAKDQNGATECDSPSTILKGRNYMKYMCDEINNLK